MEGMELRGRSQAEVSLSGGSDVWVKKDKSQMTVGSGWEGWVVGEMALGPETWGRSGFMWNLEKSV